MRFHFGKKESVQKKDYDRDHKVPIIRASICTGEQVAGFKDLKTGQFEEIMFIANDADKKEFLEIYDIDPSELKKEW